MGMVVMEHLTPRMVIIHSPPLTSQLPSPVLEGWEEKEGEMSWVIKKKRQIISTERKEGEGQGGGLLTKWLVALFK